GLLALASVLGVGEGHLLHRETRWVGSRYFAKSESLFQSFPRQFYFFELFKIPRMRGKIVTLIHPICPRPL
ncbi:MAG: hypothetical protein ACOZF1_07515, partial [Pseudomonadota bacterium]